MVQQASIGTMKGETTRCSYGLSIGSSVTNLLATNNQFLPCVTGDVQNSGGTTVHVINNMKSNGTYG
jgi:hypothetical protein